MPANTSVFTKKTLQTIEATPGGRSHLDLVYGNQAGFAPAIGGLAPNNSGVIEEYLASSAYVKQPLIPVLLAFPDYLDFVPENAKSLKAQFKCLVENAFNSIQGFNAKMEVQTEEHGLGHSQEMMEEVMDVTVARSSISYNFTERAGKPIQRLLDHVIRYGMMDPYLKVPLIKKYMTQGTAEDLKKLYLPNMYRFCALYIEPDRTMTQCIDAFLGVNMFFKNSGDRDGGRDPKSRTKLVEYDIDVASIVLCNENTIEFGQKILNSMSIHDQMPKDILINPLDAISDDVKDFATGYQYQHYAKKQI